MLKQSLRKRSLAGLGLVLLLAVFSSPALAAKGGKKVATVDIPVNAAMYAATPQPLTPAQCAQCHSGEFGDLKDDGGRHRFECQKCHAKFHAYNPKKGNYEDIMPKCASCHAAPHGPAIVDCASCHSNPHTPKKVAMTVRLTNSCGQCHPGPAEQLLKYPSKHTKVACQRCHTSHGYKPSCFNCHKPHTKGQEVSTCVKCHPVHMPREITYSDNTPAATCGGCHGKIYAKWQKTASKHGKVNCAVCHHNRHKFIPKCTECHGSPHSKDILARFPNCLGCHLDVHDLPVSKSKK